MIAGIHTSQEILVIDVLITLKSSLEASSAIVTIIWRPGFTNIVNLSTLSNRGKNQALVGAIPSCGECPGPRFEDKFRSANQMHGISKAGGDKMAAS